MTSNRASDTTPHTSNFTFALDVHDDTAVISLSGEMDLASIERFDQVADAALATESEHVLVDLSQLRFIDSSGMRALLRLQSRVGDRAHLELIPGPPAVQRVFELVGLTAALPFRE
jgi:anti-anti-sigma factor